MTLLCRFAAVFLVGLCACTPSESVPPAWFVEEAAERGIDFRHISGFDGRFRLPGITGSGAALADLDGDGDLDIYLVQSGLLGEQNTKYVDRLYLNRGDGYFDPGPAVPDGDGYGMGVAAGDYDNDGDVDLYVTNVGANALLRNDGSGRFQNVAADAGVAEPGWGASAAFLDLDGDGHLDLYVANYIKWSEDAELECFMAGVRTYCPPQNYKASAPDVLFRNNGDGTFSDVSREAGLKLKFGNGFGVVGADFDGNGHTDVFVANDMTVNQLWLNHGGMTFVESALAWGCGVDEYGQAKAGMGVAAADIDEDADTDVLVVNLEGQTDSLFLNQGGWFEDATAAFGLASSSRKHTRFGVALVDFDNDGYLDLFEANGRVAHIESGEGDLFAEPNMLHRGSPAGRFDLVTPAGGVSPPLVNTSRGLAAGDIDNDGAIDLLVVNRDAPPHLLMNRTPARGWMRFRVFTRHGRDAHAATVSLRVGGRRMYRDVQPAASYLSSNDPRVHFGLGDSNRVTDVAVRWPDGEMETFGNFEGGQTVQLQRGDGAVQ